MANIRTRIHHRSVAKPIWVIRVMTTATPTSPHDHQSAGPEARVEQPAGQLGSDHHADGLGKGVEARLQGRQAECDLEEQGRHEQDAEEGGHTHHEDKAGRPEESVSEQAQLQDGLGGPELDPHHGGEQHRPDDDAAQDDRGTPPVVRAPH